MTARVLRRAGVSSRPLRPTWASPRVTDWSIEANATRTNRGVRSSPRAISSAMSTSNPTTSSGSRRVGLDEGRPTFRIASPAKLRRRPVCRLGRGVNGRIRQRDEEQRKRSTGARHDAGSSFTSWRKSIIALLNISGCSN